MKKLVQSKTQFLKDMLDGMCMTHPELEIIADTVVVKKHKKTNGVALVSGGGSGHEPAHAGYVAEGMLDAAVCGEVFTSPTPDKVLEAIKAVDTGDGVLLIVKNYAGDIMNFEMAQELAEMEGIRVRTVVVKDDIAVENETQRRGVAGTVLVHKLAGYLAEQGEDLETIATRVESFLTEVHSIGMALTPPMVPTTGQYGFDIEADEMEIGVGIHGEKGLQRVPYAPIQDVVSRLFTELDPFIPEGPSVVMVNGMGGTPLSELHIVTTYVAAQLETKGVDVAYWLVGDYMTALDMQGFSLTLAPATPDVLSALKAPTTSRYFK